MVASLCIYLGWATTMTKMCRFGVLTFWPEHHTIQLVTTIHPFGDSMCPEVLQQCLQLSGRRFGQGREGNCGISQSSDLFRVWPSVWTNSCQSSKFSWWWCIYSIDFNSKFGGMRIETDCVPQETCEVLVFRLVRKWHPVLSTDEMGALQICQKLFNVHRILCNRL